MPSYLERVVSSGARTSPTARPPLTIAPPVPVPPRPATAIELLGLDGEPSLPRLDPDAPHPGPMPSARPAPAADPAPSRPEAAAETSSEIGAAPPFRAMAAARPARDVTIIRAPRGLRPDVVAPPGALDEAPTLAPPVPRSAAFASPSAGPSLERPETAPPAPDAAAPAFVAPAPIRPGLAARPPGARPAGEEPEGLAIAAISRAPAAASDAAASGDAGREPPHREPPSEPSPRAVSTPPSAWLQPALPPAVAPAVPRAHAREHRITIGRIDVEVHNESPSPPASGMPARVATSAPRPSLASRFLLKP